MNKKLKIILVLGMLVVGSTSVSALLDGLTDMLMRFFDWISDGINDFVQLLLDKIIDRLTWNPDITIVRPLIDDFIELLTPLYIIAFIIIGLYFFLLSESPKGRARARSALLKLLLSLAFVLSASLIYQFLLDLSELLVNFVINLVEVDLSAAARVIVVYMATYPLFWIVYALIILLLDIVFALRYVLLLIMAAIFPLTIFFFFFEVTKNYGRKLMRYTFMLIFTPVIQAIILIFFITTMNNIGEAETAGGEFAVIAICIAGFILMILAPWMGLGLLKWFGGLVCFVGFVMLGSHRMRIAMGLILGGGLMMGEGPGAIPMAATIWFIGQLEHGSEAAEIKLASRAGKPPPKPPPPPRRRQLPKKWGPGWIPGGGMTPRGASATEAAIIRGDKLMEEGYRLKAEGRSEYKDRFREARESYEKAIELSSGVEESVDKDGRLSDAERADAYAKKILSDIEKSTLLSDAERADAYAREKLSEITDAEGVLSDAERDRLSEHYKKSYKPSLSDAERAELYEHHKKAYKTAALSDAGRAEIYAKMAESCEQAGRTKRAKMDYENAIKSYEEAINRESDPKKKARYTKELAECTSGLADVLYKRG
jgi:hypothetical protein